MMLSSSKMFLIIVAFVTVTGASIGGYILFNNASEDSTETPSAEADTENNADSNDSTPASETTSPTASNESQPSPTPESKWEVYNGTVLKGSTTDGWTITELLNGDGSENLAGESGLTGLLISKDGKPVLRLKGIDGVGSQLHCTSEIPVFSDTNKSYYDNEFNEAKLRNEPAPRFVEVTQSYSDIDLLGNQIRRVDNTYYVDFSVEASFDPNCTMGMAGSTSFLITVSNHHNRTFLATIEDKSLSAEEGEELDKILNDLRVK